MLTKQQARSAASHDTISESTHANYRATALTSDVDIASSVSTGTSFSTGMGSSRKKTCNRRRGLQHRVATTTGGEAGGEL